MEKTVIEFVNSEITAHLNETKNTCHAIVLVNRIAAKIAPRISDEVTGYSKQKLYDYLKTNLPILSSLTTSNVQLLAEILKDLVDKRN